MDNIIIKKKKKSKNLSKKLRIKINSYILIVFDCNNLIIKPYFLVIFSIIPLK